MIATFRRYLKTAKSYGCFEALHPDRFKSTMIAEISTGQQIAIDDDLFTRKVLDRQLNVHGCTQVLERMLVDKDPRKPLQVAEFKNFSFLCSFIDKQLRRKDAPRSFRPRDMSRLGVLLLLLCGYVVKADQAFITSSISGVQRKLPPLILPALEQLKPIDLLRAAHGEMISRNRPDLLFPYVDRLGKLLLEDVPESYLCEVLEDSSNAKQSTGLELLQGLLIDALIARMPATASLEQLVSSLRALANSKVNLKDSKMQRLSTIVSMKLGITDKTPAEKQLVVTAEIDHSSAVMLLSCLADIEKTHTHGFIVFEAFEPVLDQLVAVCKEAAETGDFIRICHRLYRALYVLKYHDMQLLLECVRSMVAKPTNLKTYGFMLRYVSLCVVSIHSDQRLRVLLLSHSLDRLASASDDDLTVDQIAICLWSLCIIYQPFEIVAHTKLLAESLFRLHRDKDMPLHALSMICTAFEYMKSAYVPPDGISFRLISNLRRIKELHNKQVSMLNLEVVEVLNRLRIPNTIEKKLGILEVDVVVKGVLPSDIDICIDVHGYQHYFRNHDELLGHNYLKSKMIKQLGYGYFEIALPVWGALDLEGKKQYVMEGIGRLRLPASKK